MKLKALALVGCTLYFPLSVAAEFRAGAAIVDVTPLEFPVIEVAVNARQWRSRAIGLFGIQVNIALRVGK